MPHSTSLLALVVTDRRVRLEADRAAWLVAKARRTRCTRRSTLFARSPLTWRTTPCPC